MARYTPRQRANYRLIEIELRQYKQTKARLQQLREDVAYSSRVAEGPPAEGVVGDPTATRAMRLMTSPEIWELQDRVGAIEYALGVYQQVDALRIKAIEMRYINTQLSITAIAVRLGKDETTIRRWIREFIHLVAERLGWEV